MAASTKIGRYVKAAGETKRYQIDYTNWLDTGETVVSVTFTVNNQDAGALSVHDIQVLPTGLGVQYYVSAGADGSTYDVTATLTTSTSPSQVREDDILFTIRGT